LDDQDKKWRGEERLGGDTMMHLEEERKKPGRKKT